MVIRFIVFLVINFAALGIGGFFTGSGVTSEWYLNLNKAPWTPPGWVFGAAWTTIMILFSIYLAILWPEIEEKRPLILLFGASWLLNVGWNPLFFHFQDVFIALVTIIGLTAIIIWIMFKYWNEVTYFSLLLLPYIVWLVIATSLNAYIYLKN